MITREYNKEVYTLESAKKDAIESGYDILTICETSDIIFITLVPKVYGGI